MLIVTREGNRRCKLRPSQRAMVAMVYLREHTERRRVGISESTAHAYTSAVVGLLATLERHRRRSSMSFFELATDRVMCREAQRTRPPSC
ncbi:hypothetical protein SMICM17S_10206 [Streptomyces microflavus]